MDAVTSPLETIIDVDEEDEPDSALIEAETKYNDLHERFIALKALTETLKEGVKQEKRLWRKELEETVQDEKKMKEHQQKHLQEMAVDGDEYRKKIDMFKEFMFFCKANEKIERTVRKHSYQKWLTEVDSKCSIELDKIEKSLMALKPLQEMALKWTGDDAGDRRIQFREDDIGGDSFLSDA